MDTSGGPSSLREDAPESAPQAPERPPLNRRAVWALVTGVLLPVPVGAYLGFTALRRIRAQEQRGRRLAIVAIVVSIVTMAVWSFSVRPGYMDDPEPVGWQRLAVGDCFDRPAGDTTPGGTYYVLACRKPHRGEVVGSTRIDSAGGAGTRARVERECRRLSVRYSMDSWAVPESVELRTVSPTSLGRTMGVERVLCLMSSPHQKLTASLRRDSRSLDRPQFGYLDAVNTRWEYDLDHAPPHGRVSADSLTVYRKWAGGQARADQAEINALISVRWPGRARRPAEAFVRGMRRERGAWGRAAKAGSVAEFKRLRLIAEAGTARPEANALRGALRLATDPGRHQAA